MNSVLFEKSKRGIALIEVVLALTLFSLILANQRLLMWSIESLVVNNQRKIMALSNASGIINDKGFEFRSYSSREYSGLIEHSSFWPVSSCFVGFKKLFLWLNNLATSSVDFRYVDFDIKEAKRLGGDCGGYPDKLFYKGLKLLDSVNFDRNIKSVDIFRDKIFIALADGEDDPTDLLVLPVSNPRNFSSVDFGAALNKLDVVSGHGYAAQNSTSTQLVVFDHELSSYSTSTLPNVAGDRPEGFSIFYYDSRVFIGTKRTAGHEFHVFDVFAPSSPVWLGSREMNHNINDIAVVGHLAFLATSGNVRDMIVLDVGDPGNIRLVAEIDLPGDEDALSIFAAGNRVILGRNRVRAIGNDELVVLSFEVDQENGFDARVIATTRINGSVSAIKYFYNQVIVGANRPEKSLQIFNLDAGSLINKFSLDLAAGVSGIDFENNLIAVASGNTVLLFTAE